MAAGVMKSRRGESNGVKKRRDNGGNGKQQWRIGALA